MQEPGQQRLGCLLDTAPLGRIALHASTSAVSLPRKADCGQLSLSEHTTASARCRLSYPEKYRLPLFLASSAHNKKFNIQRHSSSGFKGVLTADCIVACPMFVSPQRTKINAHTRRLAIGTRHTVAFVHTHCKPIERDIGHSATVWRCTPIQ